MFEITQLAAADTFVLELLSVKDEPLVDKEGAALTVTVYGPGSKAFAQAQAARSQRIIDRMTKAGTKNVRLGAEEQAAETATFLAACTAGIGGWSYKGGIDQAAITAAYTDPTLGWLTQQVDAAIGNWANFSRGSATS